MLHTEKVVVVEGKYDEIKLSSIIDATIIKTDGFGIFKDKEKQELLARLAKKRGLIVLTDSDSAGFMIRNFLGSRVPESSITNVYIPDVFGKEKRKCKPSAEGKLGVEGVPTDVLREAFKMAGITDDESVCTSENPSGVRRQITSMDFYEDGITGRPDSKAKRALLKKQLGLPERLSSSSLLKIINVFTTYDEYKQLVSSFPTVKLPAYVSAIISVLEDAGFSAYAVGGCIRDVYLSRTPDDWDVTTNALPNEIIKAFDGYHTIPTGIEHGTVMVVMDGNPVEITTYRIDGEYEDNRHPTEVKFTDNLYEDLSRRDFTINTLAYNDKTGVLDKFSGISDLEKRLIKSVGVPDVRFNEDALRIMRALRFASVLGFDIDKNTGISIHKNAHLLSNVSAERISCELLKLLCGQNVTNILIEYRDVFAVIIPELIATFDFDQKNKHHIYSVYDHIAYAVGYSEQIPCVRLALLLHDIGKPNCFSPDKSGVGHFPGHGKRSAEISEPILKRLRLDSKTQKTVMTLVLNHDCPIEANRKSVKLALKKFGEENLRLLMKVKVGDSLSHNPEFSRPIGEIQEIISLTDEIVASGECVSISELQIKGTDIKELGCRFGPEVGRILERLLMEVIDGNLENERGALRIRAKNLIQGV